MAGIKSLDAFLAKIIKRSVADVDGSGKISKAEEALFTYMGEAKELADTLEYTNSDKDYEPVNWAEVNRKLNSLQKFGDLTMASSAAYMMSTLDADNDGTIEDEEIEAKKSNQNVENINEIFGEEGNNAAAAVFNFDNMLKYAELVNQEKDENGKIDAEITESEAAVLGNLVKSENGVKLKDGSGTDISKVDFLAAVKAHMENKATAAQKIIIENIQKGKYIAITPSTGGDEPVEKPLSQSKENIAAFLNLEVEDIIFDENDETQYNDGVIYKFADRAGNNYILQYHGNGKVSYVAKSNADETEQNVKQYDENSKLIQEDIVIEEIEVTYKYSNNTRTLFFLKIGNVEIEGAKSYVKNDDGTYTVTFSGNTTKVYNADLYRDGILEITVKGDSVKMYDKDGLLSQVQIGDKIIICPENGTLTEITDSNGKVRYQTYVASGNTRTPDTETNTYNEKGQLIKTVTEKYEYYQYPNPHAEIGDAKAKRTTVIAYMPDNSELQPAESTKVQTFDDSYIDMGYRNKFEQIADETSNPKIMHAYLNYLKTTSYDIDRESMLLMQLNGAILNNADAQTLEQIIVTEHPKSANLIL